MTPAEAALTYYRRFGPGAGYPAEKAEIDAWFRRLCNAHFGGDEAATYAALRQARQAARGH